MNVLITDTGSVFGHALALEYLNTGADVYGISKRSNDQLSKYVNYYHLLQDIEIIDGLDMRLSDFLGYGKTFDLAILNADAEPVKQEIRKTTTGQIINAININVLVNKIIIDVLLEKASAIYQVVAISSGALKSSARGWNAYAISKSALNTLMRLYAREVPGTHFSALDPGMTDRADDKSKQGLYPEKEHPVAKNLKEVDKKGNIPDPVYAANYMVEAMGIILQEESGTYRDVRDLFFSRELTK